MKIDYKMVNKELTILIEGSINSKTAEYFEKAISSKYEEAKNIILDFSKVDYLSSAGLRVILVFENKSEEDNKEFKIINVSNEVKEVFDITGFSTFLNIE